MRTSILVLAAAAVTLAGASYAQQTPPPPPGDPLGNAAVTRADAQTRASAMFDRFDANHDGKLDPADRGARATAMFDRIDANHDGAISRTEFTTAQGQMGQRMGGRRGMMKQADRPPLSRQAFVAEAMKRFDAADTNHDGKLTREERRTAFRGQRGMKRGGRPGADMPPPPPPGMGN